MGRKLTVYMLDGTAIGSKTIEIGNWSGKAIYSPRVSLKTLLSRNEFNSPGVYFLRSESKSYEFNDSVYIGEAEELRARLKQHIADRDFDSVICFLSKDDTLTKAHIKYLESSLIILARNANSSYIENGNKPKGARLCEADISDMDYFIEQIQLILPTVGISTLIEAAPHIISPILPIDRSSIYHIKSKLLNALMIETESGFIVKAGSYANPKISNSLSEGWFKIRKKLLDAAILKQEGEKLIFAEDASFSSPSAAASVVLGRQAPGPIVWLNAEGQTYKQMQENNEIEVKS